jgi:hypothetical protein
MHDIFSAMNFLPAEQTPLANTATNVKDMLFSLERKGALC